MMWCASFSVLSLLLLTVTGTEVPAGCEGKCPQKTYQHYTAKGCEPVFDRSVSECCPVRFNCDSAPTRDQDKCYYRGVAYAVDQDVPVANPCEVGCRCSAGFSGSPSTECASVECPNLFIPGLDACIESRSVDNCCPNLLSGCEPSPFGSQLPIIRGDVTCTVDGKTYREHEEIYPESDPCRYCVCNDNFTDIYGASCRQIDCGLDYRDRDKLDRKCTPIYFDGGCCPFEWICPNDPKIPESAANLRVSGQSSSATHCSLGEISVAVGDLLPVTSDRIVCNCSTPPEFSCVEYPDAQKAKDVINAANANKRDECEGKCPQKTYQHYTAKGCEPVFDRSVSECCPVRFNCDSAPTRDQDKCYYRGVAYAVDQDVPVANPCEVGCRCSAGFSGSPSTECASVECPNLFIPGLDACIESRSVDNCCPNLLSGCEPSPFGSQLPIIRGDVTCTVDGKTYREHEEIYPESDPCRYCVCNDNFTDIYGASCRQIDCGLDYRDRDKLDRKCTPIYFDGGCCPFEWICPNDPKIPESAANLRVSGQSSSATHCSLGEISVAVGDLLPVTSDRIVCNCSTPPEFSCVEYPDAQKAKDVINAANAFKKDNCPIVTYEHYNVRGCEPVFEKSSSCPVRFNCDVAPKREKNKCYYKGVAYSDGESVPVGNPCKTGCRCSTTNPSQSPETNCAFIECPSLFTPSVSKCNKIRSIDRCCDEIIDCPGDSDFSSSSPAVTRNTVTCNVEGVQYNEYDEIYPTSDPCKVCICNENFTNTNGPTCRKSDCGIDYRDREELDKGCIPIYYDGTCCPIDWLCQQDSRIAHSDAGQVADIITSSRNSCTLGTISLPVGETLATNNPLITCRCETPPDFTCVQYRDEEKSSAARKSGRINF